MDKQSCIRLAAEEDIDAIAHIHLISSRVAYKGIYSDELLAGLTLEGRIRLWRERRDALGDDARIWLCDTGREIAGFAVTDRADGVEVGAGASELRWLYVAPQWWGRGVGRELMLWLLRDLQARGFVETILWTIVSNIRARRFYEDAGFSCSGVTRERSRRESGLLLEYQEIRYSRAI